MDKSFHYHEPKTMHYYEAQDQIRIRLRSSGDFRGGALCGNGSAHARITSHVRLVNCKRCKEIINRNKPYYEG